MIPVRLYGPLIAAALVGGCVIRASIGQDTPRPWDTRGIQLGRSTVADLNEVYGEPTRRTENVVTQPPNPAEAANFQLIDDVTLVYQNGDRVVAAYPLLRQVRFRTTTFRLHNGVLTGYAFASGFPEDARAIDFDQAETLLHSEATSAADLIAVIGFPQSRQTQAVVIVPAPLPSTPTRHSPLVPPVIAMNQVSGEFDKWTSTVRDTARRVTRTETLNVTFGPGGHLLRYTRDAMTPAP